MQSDWDASAEAWIESLKAGGDFSRVAVLDRPMLAAVHASGAQRVLDVGCGEGRFCRMMAEIVPQVVGLDPTVRLLSEARKLGGAQYAQGRAEDMPFEDGDFDLVVSYLSLIDIPDSAAAIAEMARVVRPGRVCLDRKSEQLGYRRPNQGVRVCPQQAGPQHNDSGQLLDPALVLGQMARGENQKLAPACIAIYARGFASRAAARGFSRAIGRCGMGPQ